MYVPGPTSIITTAQGLALFSGKIFPATIYLFLTSDAVALVSPGGGGGNSWFGGGEGSHIRFIVKAMWHAAGDVVLVTALFFFALAWRHPCEATIDTLILINKALAIHLSFIVKAMWHAAGDVILVTALFFFALAWRHPVEATIDTLVLVNKALVIY